jgi:hypothetical protein
MNTKMVIMITHVNINPLQCIYYMYVEIVELKDGKSNDLNHEVYHLILNLNRKDHCFLNLNKLVNLIGKIPRPLPKRKCSKFSLTIFITL